MKTYYPDYYKDFKCVAGKCSHNCCIGWEIDIDEDTYIKYKNVGGKFGKRLSEDISTEGEPHFCLKSDERCAFLNKDNLCDIIIHLGEEFLCHICDMHPRFINYFSKREEIGLGLCCESASELILLRNDKTEIMSECEHTDGTDEEELLFAERDEIFSIIQNRNLHIKDRIAIICDKYDIVVPFNDFPYWADIFRRLERLDNSWDTLLDSLSETSVIPDKYFCDDWAIAGEHLMFYFIYRYMAVGMYDDTIKERIAFAVLSYTIILAICASSQTKLTEVARQYSSEIEYSDENLYTIFDILAQYSN